MHESQQSLALQLNVSLDVKYVMKRIHFPRYWPIVGEFTSHRWIPLTKASDAELPLICAWINGWVNNNDAGDLRRHRAHYDVIVMQHVVIR